MAQMTEKELQMAAEAANNAEKNRPIYSTGLRSKLEALLSECNINEAKKMFACYHDDAMKAIKEFNVADHKINFREDKFLEDNDVYEVCKVTRAIQKTTNQVGTFFMFGNNISINMANDPEDFERLRPAFKLFCKYLDKHYFYEKLYEAREVTGAETECAKIYKHYTDEDGESHVKVMIRKNSAGDILYPMFNQYGDMVAFAVEYKMRSEDGKRSETHFEVYTKKMVWEFSNSGVAGNEWVLVDRSKNVFGKIPVIYYRHETDWDGSQCRIDRLEWVDSKRGDTTDYFGDPILLLSPDFAGTKISGAEAVGKAFIAGDANSKMEFIAPPDSGQFVKDEKDDLQAAISQDTMTPDWSYKNIMGLGTLSGEAMRRVNLAGYVKRTRFSVKVYKEMIMRELNLVKAILVNYELLGDVVMARAIDELEFKFKYIDPFVGGIEDNSTELATLAGAGVMSIHASVMANRNIENKDEEEEKIWEEYKRKAQIDAEVSASASARAAESTDPNDKTKEEE